MLDTKLKESQTVSARSLQLTSIFLIIVGQAMAQNPFIRDQFSADPSARVFGSRVYVFPSHDILATQGKGRIGWFCMEDYHVFSSQNLTDWTDHGVIVRQNEVPWVKKNSYSMWAPDCIFRNGKYYFYFPTTPQDTTYAKRFTVGVAVADKPAGPYVPQAEPIKGVRGIDPNVFIDKDGQAYLYWSEGNIYGARLKENMIELASEPKILGELPVKGLKEGPYMIERNGVYYLTYPHVENKIERLEYAIGNNPLGPFKFAGVIMDESPIGCWTNHHSIVQFKNQWYLFYHHNDYSPQFDKSRSVRIDSLFFNKDGTIQKVTPTLRGVGLTDPLKKIELDRYSLKSDNGVSIDFLDSANRFSGWKTVLEGKSSWIQYNSVNFSRDKLNSIQVRALSKTGGALQIRLDNRNGPVIATIDIPPGHEWTIIKAPLALFQSGVHNLVAIINDNANVEIDWVSFTH